MSQARKFSVQKKLKRERSRRSSEDQKAVIVWRQCTVNREERVQPELRFSVFWRAQTVSVLIVHPTEFRQSTLHRVEMLFTLCSGCFFVSGV